MVKYKVGQEITIEPLSGECLSNRPRKATVLQEYEHFYLVKTVAGYRECIPKIKINAVD